MPVRPARPEVGPELGLGLGLGLGIEVGLWLGLACLHICRKDRISWLSSRHLSRVAT